MTCWMRAFPGYTYQYDDSEEGLIDKKNKSNVIKYKYLKDLFDQKENKNCSLCLNDYDGSWVISDKGRKLTRIHIDSDMFKSYYSETYTNGDIKYLMVNGHTITVGYNYKKKYFTINTNENSRDDVQKYYEYKWIKNKN